MTSIESQNTLSQAEQARLAAEAARQAEIAQQQAAAAVAQAVAPEVSATPETTANNDDVQARVAQGENLRKALGSSVPLAFISDGIIAGHIEVGDKNIWTTPVGNGLRGRLERERAARRHH